MDDRALEALRWQFEMTWRLAEQHVLPPLTDEMCLWAPAPRAWTVRRVGAEWVADWADAEPDPPPATSIAWIAWQAAWWWSEALARAEGAPPPRREGVRYPGTAEGVRAQLGGLAVRWRTVLASLDAEALARPSTFPWTEPQPFATTVAWVNSELMKNLAEIGLLGRLHLSREK
ncbi:DinB family protein [Phenylobacterium sp.]|uniref:DinB family protein n=1 Tax=Phenylobacterium sp. TaxID=1871053 RepID=UPI002F954ECC